MDREVSLPIGDGVVVRLSDYAESRRMRKLRGKCQHTNIELDITVTTIQCIDCGQQINPVAWIYMLINEWHEYERAAKAYLEALKEYQERSRTKCSHCGKMTDIRPKKR